MSEGTHTIAIFRDQVTARKCMKYARAKYSLALPLMARTTFRDWPEAYAIAVSGPGGRERVEAIAFIKGYAYALGSASHVPEVMCRGDERTRYGIEAL